MNVDDIARVATLLGISPKEKKMVILSTIANARYPITAEEIKHKSGIRCSTQGTRSAFYRALSQLREEKLIDVYTNTNRHYYHTQDTLIQAWLDKLIQEKKDELLKQLEEIKSKRDLISEICSEDLKKITRHILQRILGHQKSHATSFNLGAHQLVELMHRKIIQKLRNGDTIRMSLEWGVNGFFDIDERTMNMLGRLLQRGISVKVLGPAKRTVNEAVFKQIRKKYYELSNQSGNIEVRHRTRTEKTYNVIAKNRDDVILVVSQQPYLMTQYIPYDANPELVDDIIETFDNEFKNAIPL